MDWAALEDGWGSSIVASADAVLGRAVHFGS